MVKVVLLVKRRKDLTREQFKEYWLTHHIKLERDSLKKDPIKKIVASFATGEVLGANELPYDAMVELYFDSIDDMRTQFKGDRDSINQADEKHFLDPLEPRIFVVTEEVIIGEKTITGNK